VYLASLAVNPSVMSGSACCHNSYKRSGCEVHLLREIHEYIGCVTTPDGHVIVDLDAEYLGATCSLLAQVGAALAQAEGRTP
jgi:hypothetical protein